ncbi:MAG: endonuclease domain-containing protein [Candidatus Gracilibacteria bacterium]|nr:endonuclease domain-containing protein [Candidatus Gracilibacteria bacterium]
MYIVPNNIVEIGRNLRKNMTYSEKILWNELKNNKLGVKFLRQNPMYVYTEDSGLNRFIFPDFYCKEKKIIIEVDGNIHNLKEVYELDIYKEKILNKNGIKVIRIKNDDLENNLNLVLEKIKTFLL